MTNRHSGFSSLNIHRNPDPLIQYLDSADYVEFVQDFRQRCVDRISKGYPRKVLELGCGVGTLMGRLGRDFPEHTFCGFDIHPALVEEARRRHGFLENCHFVLGQGQHLPVRRHSIDTVIIERVLQHVEHPIDILRECHRALKPRAFIVIGEPDWSDICVAHPDMATTKQILNSYRSAIASASIGHELEHLLQLEGFSEIQVEKVLWDIAFPLSGQVLGLARCSELAEISGMPSAAALHWAETFQSAKVSMSLPFYQVIAKA